MRPRAIVVGREDGTEVAGPQGQALIPLITAATAGASSLSGGVVWMPPGGASRAHSHDCSEIIVAVLVGSAATVVWENGRPRQLLHGVGDMCYVPPGVPHCAVNVSLWHPVVALEFRTDPEFNTDVILLPELESELATLVIKLQRDSPATDPRANPSRTLLRWWAT